MNYMFTEEFEKLPEAVKQGYMNAFLADMEATRKPNLYDNIEPTYVSWPTEIKELAKDVGKIVLAIAAVNFLGASWFD